MRMAKHKLDLTKLMGSKQDIGESLCGFLLPFLQAAFVL
jgi:hypothetical protein